jgi:hypothetical protein
MTALGVLEQRIFVMETVVRGNQSSRYVKREPTIDLESDGPITAHPRNMADDHDL